MQYCATKNIPQHKKLQNAKKLGISSFKLNRKTYITVKQETPF
jgi:hypothetical protein